MSNSVKETLRLGEYEFSDASSHFLDTSRESDSPPICDTPTLLTSESEQEDYAASPRAASPMLHHLSNESTQGMENNMDTKD